MVRVIVTDAAELPSQWDQLAWACGSPFHSKTTLGAFERTWPGDPEPCHILVNDGGQSMAAIPAYFTTYCPRLDYYRTVDQFNDLILVSHSLAGCYGAPMARSTEALHLAVEGLIEVGLERSAAILFRHRCDGYGSDRSLEIRGFRD